MRRRRRLRRVREDFRRAVAPLHADACLAIVVGRPIAVPGMDARRADPISAAVAVAVSVRRGLWEELFDPKLLLDQKPPGIKPRGGHRLFEVVPNMRAAPGEFDYGNQVRAQLLDPIGHADRFSQRIARTVLII